MSLGQSRTVNACGNACVGQTVAQEGNEIRLLLRRQTKRTNAIVIDVRRIEVAAAIVEVNYFLECPEMTVVKIRCA